MIGSRRRIGKFWGRRRGFKDVLADDVPEPPLASLALGDGESLQAEVGVVLISLILLHAGRWDPVFLSEKWQDGSRAGVGAVCPGRAPLQPQTDAV